MKRFATICAALAGVLAGPTASAEVPKTQPPDLGYGQNRLADRYRFPEDAKPGRVDRRRDVDAAAHRAILMPMAYVPPRNTVSYSNHMVLLNQLSWSATDSVMLTAAALLPRHDVDLNILFSAKAVVLRTWNTTLSVVPHVSYRQGSGDLPTSDMGLGGAFLADFNVSDDFVLNLGLTPHFTFWYGFTEADFSACSTRSEYLDGDCSAERTESASAAGGHFLVGQVAGNYYVTDRLSLRAEVLSGAAAGTVLGTDFLHTRPTPERRRAQFESPDLEIGAPTGSQITLGAGVGWSYRYFALQLSGYLYRSSSPFGPTWVATPMVNIAATL